MLDLSPPKQPIPISPNSQNSFLGIPPFLPHTSAGGRQSTLILVWRAKQFSPSENASDSRKSKRKGSSGRGHKTEGVTEGVRTKFLQKMPLLFDGRGCAHQVHYRHTLENLGTEPALVGIIFRKPQNKIPNPSDLKMTAALS